jgi:hypothetical protein
MRVTPLVITAALVFASACGDSESSEVATATTTTPTTTAAPPGTAAVDTTTTAPASTTTTTDVGCADPPVCFYAAGENVCSVDGNAPCADDPRNIYVNETIGFSFAFDKNWRRLGTDTDGRIQLVHEYFVPGDPFIVVSWEPTMGRNLDMFADELIASADNDAIGAWDWATDELGGFEWESAEGSVPQRNVRAVHPDPYSGQAILIESIGSCMAFCEEAVRDEAADPQWNQTVGMIRDTWTWLEPAEREVDECNVLGGGRYRVRFPAGAFGTRIECALVRGETYLFRVGVADGQTLTARVSSAENNAVLALTAPSGELLAEGVVGALWSDTDAGSYEIIVGSIRGNAPFALEIDVR